MSESLWAGNCWLACLIPIAVLGMFWGVSRIFRWERLAATGIAVTGEVVSYHYYRHHAAPIVRFTTADGVTRRVEVNHSIWADLGSNPIGIPVPVRYDPMNSANVIIALRRGGLASAIGLIGSMGLVILFVIANFLS